MAKEIDKIIQSKTAPKSNNVLWDGGENLKINRNGKWESTGGGSDIPQEKIDSINFGYYTFASNGITANWGPFNINVGEIKTVDTLFLGWYPTYVKVGNQYIRISWDGEIGYVNSVSGRLDFKYIQNKITIDATHINKACIIQFYDYRKLPINEGTCEIDSYLLHNLSLKKEVYAYEGDKLEVDVLSSLGKYTQISTFTSSKRFSIFSGLLLFYDCKIDGSQIIQMFRLLNYENTPCVITVNVYCDSNNIVTDYDSTTQEISLK